jgi:Domain of unknown function (DUF4129)
VTPEEIRQLADEILARDEFRQPEPSLLERFQSWVEDLIGRIFDAAFSGGAGSIIGWAVLLGAVIAIVWFATRFGRTVQGDRRVGITVEGIHRSTPAEWRAAAEAQEAAGEWKLALRSRYRALVGELIAEGVLVDVAGRTTGEYRGDVARAAPGRAGDFAAATELFESAWYGDRPTGSEENGRFQALARAVTSGVSV